ncbi:MAG TPA: CoA ester lyase [Solirubrobacteraceae bacterium]
MLYTPGANTRALDAGRRVRADALIFDLEDAVSPAAKIEARELVCSAIADGGYGARTIVIRLNGIGTAWHEDDLHAAADAGPDAILVPKVGTAADVLQVETALGCAGARAHTRVWAMLETPRAILNAAEIGGCSERLTVLVMGTNDLANELSALSTDTRQPLLTSLSLCLLAARAAGKTILDGVYNDISDADGFEAECRHGRRLGFDGKTLIHPNQVEICNRVFSPSQDEINHARRVIEAHEDAARNKIGVAVVDGRLVENLHVAHARRILSAAFDDGIAGQTDADGGL